MKKTLLRLIVLVAAAVAASLGPSTLAKVIEVPPPAMSLAEESQAARDARMGWWREARFGMFIHWGVYSVAAGEWNGAPTKGAGEWIMNDMKIPGNDYGQLLHRFNPVHFDAQKWVHIAQAAGMKYIVITTKHHDGFCLFDSKFTDYDVMSTPFKRDIMRELSDAARQNGLKIGWYHSIMDWHDPDAQREETFATYEWRMRAQVSELLSNYGEIGVMWFDGEWIKQWNDQRGRNLYMLCRTLGPNVIVNNRVGKQRAGMSGFSKTGGFTGDYATPEQEIPQTVPPGLDWETCMTMNNTWGFKRDDNNWKSTTTLIRHLIEIASKGGNFLLNVGPTGEGDIPDASVERLQAMGRWMSVNGESIHGTTASPFNFPLSFGRCTQKPFDAAQGRPGKLYLHVLSWPGDRRITVPVRNTATKAYLLAQRDTPLQMQSKSEGIVIELPEKMPDPDATVIALEITGAPEVIAPAAAAATAPASPLKSTTRSGGTRPSTTAMRLSATTRTTPP